MDRTKYIEKIKKAVIGILAVPFVLLEYWARTLMLIHKPEQETESEKEEKRHCGAFVLSFGILLYLISLLDTSGSLLSTALLMTAISASSLLLNKKLAKMMGLDKDETFTSLLFFLVLPALSCMLLYFGGLPVVVDIFMVFYLIVRLLKLMQVMSLDFCRNYFVPLLKNLTASFFRIIDWNQFLLKRFDLKKFSFAGSVPAPSFLYCKLVVQKLE